MGTESNSHSVAMGYLLWLFGFMGAHRFYYGRPVTGIIWACTLGLFLIGWFIDLFLIPGMDRTADLNFPEGRKSYNVTWILLTFLGVLGIHRFYLEKWLSGLLYFFTVGLLGVGVLYDFCTINGQVRDVNAQP